MKKLNKDSIDKKSFHIFNTKNEMLEYIKKSSFRKDEWGYSHYEMQISYSRKKWVVRWK